MGMGGKNKGAMKMNEYAVERLLTALQSLTNEVQLFREQIAKTEPQTITMVKDHGRKQALEMINLYHELKDEPQTEMEKSGSRAVLTARCLNCHNAKACKENHWEVCKYEPWKLTAVEDEPQTMYYPQVDGITPSVIEPQTDCSWKKGE